MQKSNLTSFIYRFFLLVFVSVFIFYMGLATHVLRRQVLEAPTYSSVELSQEDAFLCASHPRSSRWKGVRDTYLAKHPTCAACGRRDHLTVHHVKPFHLYPELELDEDNLITLCEGATECHYVFGHLGNWQCSNPNVRADAAAYLLKVSHRNETKEK